MTWRIRIAICFGIVIIPFTKTPLFSQSTKAVYVDHAAFIADSGKTKIEFYIGIPKQLIDFKLKGDGELESLLEVEAVLQNKTDLPVSTSNKLLIKAKDSIQSKEGQVVNLLAVIIQQGKYDIKISVKGLKAGYHELRYQTDIDLGNTDSVMLSDIEFAADIHKSQRKDAMFYKNTMEVIPNPSLIYGYPLNEIKAYTVAYNLGKKFTDTFYTHSLIRKRSESIPYLEMEKRRRRTLSANEVVITDGYAIDALPSGSYIFRLELTDSLFNVVAVKQKTFYVYNPSVAPDTVDDSERESTRDDMFSRLDETHLNEFYLPHTYIMTSEERNIYNKTSSIEEKRRFYRQFWKKSNLESQREFFNRIEKANQLYVASYQKGYETDRGRVYIKYGEPATRDVFNVDSNTKPYEIWTYNSITNQGTVFFVFADIAGFGRYQLIHASARGELYNPNWKRLVSPTNTLGNDDVRTGGF